ncbi:MAG: lysylphosphatidylglycerol synthase transmembrane domain-containing protein, partial [Gemmatimonadaceae bacterium]
PINRVVIFSGIIAGGALTALFALALFPQFVLSIFNAVVGRIAPTFLSRGQALLESFMSGLGALRAPGRFAVVMAWAVAMWLVNALAFWIGFLAVGINSPFSAGVMLMGVIAIGVAIPSSPGFFGVFEFFAKEGLALYGVSKELAVSWSLGYHLLSFIPITLIGLYYFGRLGLRFRELGQVKAGAPAPRAAAMGK